MLKPGPLRIVLATVAFLAAPALAGAQHAAPPASPQQIADETAAPPGLPALGKWMIDRRGTTAHWLGQIVHGKRLYEPINVIFVDAAATSVEDARSRLVAAVAAAGYPIRFGHSAGYRGLIGGDFYGQLPLGRDDAFSNRLFEETNNHGRIFGAHRFGDAYIFIGAFSRERVDLLEWPGHKYASFNEARDDLARRVDAVTAFKRRGAVPLGNAIVGNPDVTTGDHDGTAVVLRADR